MSKLFNKRFAHLPSLSILRRLSPLLAFRVCIVYSVKKLMRVPAVLSFSQTGEDRILTFYLPMTRGFYVDVGANDPLRFSNTFNFYLRGWSGIAIDANEALMARYSKFRKEDTCLVAAISDTSKDATFYRSPIDALSTLNESAYSQWKHREELDGNAQTMVHTQTLTAILDTALPQERRQIDLLTIDVEGHEFEVLVGLDWVRYRPRMIAVEIHELHNIGDNRVYSLLISKRYSLVAYATMNAYFMDQE